MTSVKFEKVSQSFPTPNGELQVLEDVSYEIDKPKIVILLGPSGCGKTTLMKMAGGVTEGEENGIHYPTQGQVFINGELYRGKKVPSPKPHDDVVMLFQQYANRKDKNVWKNVEFPLTFKYWRKRVTKEEREERVRSVLDAVGLLDRKDAYPKELSGGQNQRIAIARIFAMRPKILLADEPFGALDHHTKREMHELLIKLQQETNTLVIMVTHDVEEALLLADEIVVLSTKPATVAKVFPIGVPKPRRESWLDDPKVREVKQEILNYLK